VSRGQPRIRPFGDAAFLVEWPEAIEPALNRQVHALARLVREARQSGSAWNEPVPAYASLLAPFDPLRMDAQEAELGLRTLAASLGDEQTTARDELPVLEIDVRYGGQDGPDLDEVARRTGLIPERVIELHSAGTYRAYFLGFSPGFAYLGTLAAELQLPRRDTPRQRVPAGSVAIAGVQTAVYPSSTPGGWHLIGRTDFQTWDPERDPPAVIRPGQAVRFVPRRD